MSRRAKSASPRVRPVKTWRPELPGLSKPHAAALLPSLLLFATTALSTPAYADARALDFYILRQPIDGALLDLALQARVSLGGSLTSCAGVSPAISGRMSLDAALTRLLAGSGCRHVIRQDGAVIISRRPSATPAPARPIAPRPVAPMAPPEDVAQVSEVVVTAPRRPELIQSSSSAMTAVGAERIAAPGSPACRGWTASSPE